MRALSKKMDETMVLRGFSPKTRSAYVCRVRGLAQYYRRSPDGISNEDVERYLLHLLQERGLSYSTCNQALSAARFLFEQVLGRPPDALRIPSPKVPQRLPEILSREEMVRLIEAATELKHKAVLMTTYSGGLRVSEVCRLKVTDIDIDRMMIRVEQGKAKKDRSTLLSERLLRLLRRYGVVYRPTDWLFTKRDGSGPYGSGPMDDSAPQKMFFRAKQRGGIRKHGGIHGLRHAFATHLLEDGEDLPSIQKLMGQRSIRTTMRYLHVTQSRMAGTRSPLDGLPLAD